jgi:hypothetical protein
MTSLTFFLWGFVKDEIYIAPVPITLKNLRFRYVQQLQKLISLFSKMFDANLNTILMCAGQQMEYILNLHWV